jgi:cytochrome P450
MSQRQSPDWDPRSQAVLDDQIKAYDDMRHRCPVAHSDYLHWSLFRHEDVVHALLDPATFSNAVDAPVCTGLRPANAVRFHGLAGGAA